MFQFYILISDLEENVKDVVLKFTVDTPENIRHNSEWKKVLG